MIASTMDAGSNRSTHSVEPTRTGSASPTTSAQYHKRLNAAVKPTHGATGARLRSGIAERYHEHDRRRA